MIRALAQSVRFVVASVFIAGVLLITAVLAAVTIMVYGCSMALWPPKQRPATGLTGLLLERLTRSRDVTKS